MLDNRNNNNIKYNSRWEITLRDIIDTFYFIFLRFLIEISSSEIINSATFDFHKSNTHLFLFYSRVLITRSQLILVRISIKLRNYFKNRIDKILRNCVILC